MVETALCALSAAETRVHDLEAERSWITLRVKELEQQLDLVVSDTLWLG